MLIQVSTPLALCNDLAQVLVKIRELQTMPGTMRY